MQKTVTYLYPNITKAANLKIFQDRTSQITAYYFTKESIKEIEKMEAAYNYAVYFLFDNSENNENRVYVGQSMDGVKRINQHVKKKDFWSYCIMFITDNNSFDKLSIDYLEHIFVKKFNKSSYIVTNKDLRNTEPNISIYDKPNLDMFVNQIEFLLNTEGIVFNEIESENKNDIKYYRATEGYKARLYVSNGKFVLEKGSEIRRPIESSKEWSDGGRFYSKYNEIIDKYLKSGKAEEKEGEIITLINLSQDKPSILAELVYGCSVNGWTFFKGLEELRK